MGHLPTLDFSIYVWLAYFLFFVYFRFTRLNDNIRLCPPPWKRVCGRPRVCRSKRFPTPWTRGRDDRGRRYKTDFYLIFLERRSVRRVSVRNKRRQPGRTSDKKVNRETPRSIGTANAETATDCRVAFCTRLRTSCGIFPYRRIELWLFSRSTVMYSVGRYESI